MSIGIDVTPVYFFQSASNGLVKVGFSKQVEQRRLTLERQTGGALTLLATDLGGREYEQFLHRMMAEFREHGEWFRPNALTDAYAAYGRARQEGQEDAILAASDHITHLLMNPALIQEAPITRELIDDAMAAAAVS